MTRCDSSGLGPMCSDRLAPTLGSAGVSHWSLDWPLAPAPMVTTLKVSSNWQHGSPRLSDTPIPASGSPGNTNQWNTGQRGHKQLRVSVTDQSDEAPAPALNVSLLQSNLISGDWEGVSVVTL